jgi:hypothetical protein
MRGVSRDDRPLATPVRRYRVLAIAAAALVALITGCDSTAGRPAASPADSPAATMAPVATTAPAATSAPSTSAAPPPAAPGTALAALAVLPVKGRAPMTGYTRARFGPAWSDDTAMPFGHNGCDTRNDILRRDLQATVLKAGTSGCVALSGRLDDPYTATAIAFERGVATSSTVQIDHVVALGDAWQSGAQQLSDTQRRGIANDPLNLLAVDGPANEQKGDSDAASWLPPNKAFRCTYVARQVAVKLKWHLWVTAAERAAVAHVLASCPAQRVPGEPGIAGPITVRGTTTASTAAPARSRSAPPPASTGTYYATCSAVRAAGHAPLHRGQPGYRSALDRDGDGVACE